MTGVRRRSGSSPKKQNVQLQGKPPHYEIE